MAVRVCPIRDIECGQNPKHWCSEHTPPRSQEGPSLLPCPFCGGGETQIQPQNMWTGMRNQLVCVRIRHWCEKPTRATSELTANTEEEAIAAWNRRATPSPATGGQEPYVLHEASLREAVQYFFDALDRNHDTKTPPAKYTVPWGAVNALRAALTVFPALSSPQQPGGDVTDEHISELWSWSATDAAEKTASTQIHAFARAILALRPEPAQQAGEGEPVAWSLRFSGDSRLCLSTMFDTEAEAAEYAGSCKSAHAAVPLYASPQKEAPAVQLLDRAARALEWAHIYMRDDGSDNYRRVEATLKAVVNEIDASNGGGRK